MNESSMGMCKQNLIFLANMAQQLGPMCTAGLRFTSFRVQYSASFTCIEDSEPVISRILISTEVDLELI